jgi:polysaccharide biosynthesis/export protein
MKVIEYRENMRRRIYRMNLVLGIFVVLSGMCSFTQAQSPVQNNSPLEAGNYKIGVSDVLKILVLKQDVLSQDNIRVSNEGTIRMPMLNEPIPAACLTEAQLSSEITNRYKKYLLNPQVYVTVKEFNAYPVAVIGAVNSSGRFQLQRPMRLLELLTRVNGPALNAGQYVQIFRDSNAQTCEQNPSEDPKIPTTAEATQPEIISLSLPELLKGNEAANPYVQSGDIIRVTEAEIKQAFIIGNVKSAVTINLKEPITLSRAIAMAGGFAPGAQTDKIKISRQTVGSVSQDTPIIVNLKNADKSAQADILLQPNDVVDVPGPKRSLLKDILKTIAPTVMRGVVIP